MKRRNFIKKSSQAALGMGFLGSMSLLSSCENNANEQQQQETQQTTDMFFKLSLAQWSFHKALGRGESALTLDHLDFAAKAKSLGFEGVEYVSQFFQDKAQDEAYLSEMKKRAADNGIQSLLIMIDNEGDLAITNDEALRTKNIENHYKWVEAAHFLGCHSIRVNVFGEGSPEAMTDAARDSLTRLSNYAAQENINVLVENHGGLSSDGDWMVNVMKAVNMDNCGMLPDFGNFCVARENNERWGAKCIKEFDKYEGVEMFMPFAKGVSAKSYSFDENGNETTIDYKRMLKIVKDAGYTGFIGVEYEGSDASEEEGVKLTKALLEKAAKALS